MDLNPNLVKGIIVGTALVTILASSSNNMGLLSTMMLWMLSVASSVGVCVLAKRILLSVVNGKKGDDADV